MPGRRRRPAEPAGRRTRTPPPPSPRAAPTREERKRTDADAKRRSRAEQARRSSIDRLESKIADTERAIRDIEQTMAAPGFYEDRTAAQPVIDRHQALMWEVGDLMHQWELLQQAAELAADLRPLTRTVIELQFWYPRADRPKPLNA